MCRCPVMRGTSLKILIQQTQDLLKQVPLSCLINITKFIDLWKSFTRGEPEMIWLVRRYLLCYMILLMMLPVFTMLYDTVDDVACIYYVIWYCWWWCIYYVMWYCWWCCLYLLCNMILLMMMYLLCYMILLMMFPVFTMLYDTVDDVPCIYYT